MANLYAAHAFDLAGKRDEAVSQYNEVLARPISMPLTRKQRRMRVLYKTESVVSEQLR